MPFGWLPTCCIWLEFSETVVSFHQYLSKVRGAIVSNVWSIMALAAYYLAKLAYMCEHGLDALAALQYQHFRPARDSFHAQLTSCRAAQINRRRHIASLQGTTKCHEGPLSILAHASLSSSSIHYRHVKLRSWKKSMCQRFHSLPGILFTRFSVDDFNEDCP